MARSHLAAFNRSVRAYGISRDPVLAPIVAMGRDLARTLDSSEDQGAVGGLIGMYRQLLKEMPRWMDVAVESPTATSRKGLQITAQLPSKSTPKRGETERG